MGTSLVKKYQVHYVWQCEKFVSLPADRADALAAAATWPGSHIEPVWVWT